MIGELVGLYKKNIVLLKSKVLKVSCNSEDKTNRIVEGIDNNKYRKVNGIVKYKLKVILE